MASCSDGHAVEAAGCDVTRDVRVFPRMDTMCWTNTDEATACATCQGSSEACVRFHPDGLEVAMSHGVRSRSVRGAEDLGVGARLLIVYLGSALQR